METVRTDRTTEKRLAAESAVSLVRNGMVIGLGSRSTAEIAIRSLGQKVKGGLRITGVATSRETELLARSLGIPLTTLGEHPQLDLTIDGADEVERDSLDLIKGRGGALLREKIVASCSQRLIIAVDGGKLVDRLGGNGPLPVEIVPFGWESTSLRLEHLGWKSVLRMADERTPYLTDGGHYILDCTLVDGGSLRSRGACLHNTIGVIEHGLFLGMATQVHVGTTQGVVIFDGTRQRDSQLSD